MRQTTIALALVIAMAPVLAAPAAAAGVRAEGWWSSEYIFFEPDFPPPEPRLPELRYPFPWQRALYRPRLSFDRALFASVEAG